MGAWARHRRLHPHPAALQGLVGFKNTARLTPPKARSVIDHPDTACAITRSVRDAVLLHEVLAARRVSLAKRPLEALRFGLPLQLLEGMDTTVAAAFDRALTTLRHGGARIDEIGLPELDELAAINATGGLSAAESWACTAH